MRPRNAVPLRFFSPYVAGMHLRSKWVRICGTHRGQPLALRTTQFCGKVAMRSAILRCSSCNRPISTDFLIVRTEGTRCPHCGDLLVFQQDKNRPLLALACFAAAGLLVAAGASLGRDRATESTNHRPRRRHLPPQRSRRRPRQSPETPQRENSRPAPTTSPLAAAASPAAEQGEAKPSEPDLSYRWKEGRAVLLPRFLHERFRRPCARNHRHHYLHGRSNLGPWPDYAELGRYTARLGHRLRDLRRWISSNLCPRRAARDRHQSDFGRPDQRVATWWRATMPMIWPSCIRRGQTCRSCRWPIPKRSNWRKRSAQSATPCPISWDEA